MIGMIRHLLPNARAWRLLPVTKQLSEFFDGLSGLEVDVKAFVDGVYGDLIPGTTRELSAWEDQFGIPSAGVGTLTRAARVARLEAAWSAVGGQSPRYIQDTLQANGFDVYVHEAWIPGTESPVGTIGPPTFRSPIVWLSSSSGITSGVDCGEALAECGEAFAECGNSIEPVGYPLVNIGPGDVYTVPVDSSKWPYFLYIGDVVFGDLADVPSARRDEFEALCLKICPAHVWLGMFINYT